MQHVCGYVLILLATLNDTLGVLIALNAGLTFITKIVFLIFEHFDFTFHDTFLKN